MEQNFRHVLDMATRTDEVVYDFPHIAEELRRYREDTTDRPRYHYQQYAIFQSRLGQVLTSPDSYWQKQQGPGRYHATILKVFESGAIHSEVCQLPYVPESNDFRRSIGAWIARVSATLVQNETHLDSRILVINIQDDPDVDLFLMEFLCGTFNLRLPILWHAFRIEHYWPPEESGRHLHSSALQQEHVASPWTSPRVFSMAKMHAVFLERQNVSRTEETPTGKHCASGLNDTFSYLRPNLGSRTNLKENNRYYILQRG